MKVAKFTITTKFAIAVPAGDIAGDDIKGEHLDLLRKELRKEYEKELAAKGEIISLDVEAEIKEI